MKLARKDILGIRDLSVEEINLVLDTAESFIEVSTREIKKVPTLRGVTVMNLFYEPSTRTRTSFEIAAKRLSADTINIAASTSSVVKGETFIDTAKNLEAMNPDIIVLRHSAAGAPHMLSRVVRQCVINAGDGAHEHPTQALLDMMTIREKKKRIAGLRIAIIGDIAHSRVARSNIYGLTKMGAQVAVGGPSTMMPRFIDRLGVEVHHHVDDAIRNADIIMMLRIQTERQDMSVFPS
ncbi:MAG TPA: aspartate carbamoyltransferase catalytic subunit, partial [Syntrophales bacterium]|nr:aspartate carbamoyltransferase catalytic subunit [Syntrophales bacterium]